MPQLAFPTALGAGAYVSGGRGQTVYHVTNTDFNDNPGSFKWALETAVANNGGTIVFDVSGVITIQPTVVTSYDRWLVDSGTGNDSKVLTNISILGQTAPFPGITIDTSNTVWEMGNVHNFIMRYVKFRNDGTHGFFNFRYCDELILDHVSMAYSNSDVTSANLSSVTDHNIDGSSWTPTDITCQYVLFAHGGRFSNTGNSSGDPNADFGNVSFIRNAFHEISYRTPMKSGGDGQRDIINNIVSKFRSGKRVMRFDDQPVKINHIGNIYTPSISNVLAGEGSVDNGHKIYTNNLTAFEIYNSGNDIGWIHTPDSGTTGDAEKDFWDAFRPSGAEGNPDIPSDRFVNTQHPLAGRNYNIYNTSVLKDSILSEVGDNRYLDDNGNVVYYRDGIDTRYVNDIQNNTDRNLENTTGFATYGNFTSNTRPVNFYGTNQHIPTAWLTANGYSDTANIHNQVEPDGYTVLEHYANQVDDTITKAFPTAYGAGAYLTGGRGKQVYHVTNLNETGPGSFKQAILDATDQKIGGTIVFDVSGVIPITQEWAYSLGINGGDASLPTPDFCNLSVLGQTAPEGGITLDVSNGVNWRFFDFHNVIFRYIKYRGGGNGAFQSWQYTDNIIIDHCSFAWSEYNSTGMTIGSYTDWTDYVPTNITMQNCFWAHTGRGSTIGNTCSDSYPGDCDLLPFGEVSMLRNVYTNNTWRVPLKFGGEGKVDVINNYIESTYGRAGGRQMRFDGQGVKLNHIGNHYSGGFFENDSQLGPEDLHKMYSNNPSRPTEIYQRDNWYSPNLKPIGYDQDNTLDWLEFEQPRTEPLPPQWFVQTQHPLNGESVPIIAESNLKQTLLPEVGACKFIDDNGQPGFYRDPIDTKYINDIDTENHIDNERAGTGIPVMPSSSRPGTFYQSNPHIPETYLVNRGITGDANIHNQIQPSGYTLLEEYANQVDTEIIINIPSITLIGATTINLDVGDPYNEQGATATDIEDGDISGNIVITGSVDVNTPGTYYKYYNVQDSEGNSANQVVRIINVSSLGQNIIYNLSESVKSQGTNTLNNLIRRSLI